MKLSDFLYEPTKNLFYTFLAEAKLKWEESIIEEVEDLDELCEVFVYEDLEIDQIMSLALNPWFDYKNRAVLGIKCPDWIKKSRKGFTKMEEKIIINSVPTIPYCKTLHELSKLSEYDKKKIEELEGLL